MRCLLEPRGGCCPLMDAQPQQLQRVPVCCVLYTGPARPGLSNHLQPSAQSSQLLDHSPLAARGSLPTGEPPENTLPFGG